MAMGALKQLNSDAKELQTMLQPTTQLEDWVKSKLNLAGEYLDDVYHHLDHFGSEGRTLDEGYYEDKEKERQRRSFDRRLANSIPGTVLEKQEILDVLPTILSEESLYKIISRNAKYSDYLKRLS